MKRNVYVFVLISFVIFILSSNISYSQVYEGDLPIEDIVKYIDILDDINIYGIPELCYTSNFHKYQSWENKIGIAKKRYHSYILFQEDSTRFYSGLNKFYNSNKNINKLLLKFRNSNSTCNWAYNWDNNFWLLSSTFYFKNYQYITNNSIAAAILIINYYVNQDKKDIKLFLHSENQTVDEIYNKLEKIINEYYNKDKNLVRDQIIKEFEIHYEYEE